MLDVDVVLVDVSLLMVGPQLSVLVSFHKDVVISGCDSDVVVEFFDVFIREIVEEVDDESAGDFIDFDPRRMNNVLLGLSHSLGLVSVNLVELLGLNNVEAEEVILSDLLFPRNHSLD